MAIRRPIVLVAGNQMELPIGDSVSGPSIGNQYHFNAQSSVVSDNFQYAIHGRLILDSGSSIKLEGNAQVVIV